MMCRNLIKFIWPDLRNSECGFSLIETLAAIAILGIISLGVSYNAISSFVLTKRQIRHAIALQLSQSKLEELAALDPTTFSSANNSSETSLLSNKISFDRQTTILVNSDASRSVTVTTGPSDASLGGTVTLSNTFALWGNT